MKTHFSQEIIVMHFLKYELINFVKFLNKLLQKMFITFILFFTEGDFSSPATIKK
jgi:hypothetical protein